MPTTTKPAPSLRDTLKALGHSDAVIEAMLGAADKATVAEAKASLAQKVEEAVTPALDELLDEIKAQIKRSGKSPWTGAAVSWALDERYSLKVTLTDKVATAEATPPRPSKAAQDAPTPQDALDAALEKGAARS